MIEINKCYRFKSEFAQELNLPKHQIDRRQDELLEWLQNFFDFDFFEGNPKRIIIKEIYGEYQPLPRKVPSARELTEEKKERYAQFTINSLSDEFEPNSQAKIAREAIAEFGYELYSHTSIEAVAKHYIKEPMHEYGENDGQKIWVWYTTYKPMTQEEIADWHGMLSANRISEKEAAQAFYRQEQGEDVSKEKQYFRNALKELKEKYGDIAVLVSSWRRK